MNCVGPGVPTVLIGKLPASTMGDNFLCVGPPAPVVMGAMNVLIGTGGGGGGGGGGGSTTQASAAQGLKAGTLQPIRGTETFPIDVQATLLTAANYMTPQEMHLQIKVIADTLAESKAANQQETPELTIADIVEILEAVEREEGFEAARFFSSCLDYGRLTEMAKGFISGEDTNSENDPNQMPTRFMLLYGADDNKLQQIDDHPDRADGEEHKINVANLRKALRALGYDVAETGPYDDEVHIAHVQYMAAQTEGYVQHVNELDDQEKQDDVPMGYIIIRLAKRQGNPIAKAECTLKNASGIVASGTTDQAGVCKWHDMPLDNYTVEVNGPSGKVSVPVPWSSTDKQSHTIIIRK
jgi:hypothetical protein